MHEFIEGDDDKVDRGYSYRWEAFSRTSHAPHPVV